MDALTFTQPDLLEKCQRYTAFVKRGEMSDERSEAHSVAMDSLVRHGLTFFDRDDARMLAFAIVAFNEAWQQIVEHLNNYETTNALIA